jgi:hypothetical protein
MVHRSWVRRLERGLRGELESFPLQDGSRYYFDPTEADSDLFVFSYRVRCGEPADKPEILRKLCEAKDVQGALTKVKLDPGSLASANGPLDEVIDLNSLVRERRIVVFEHTPPEDLSE